MDPGHRGRPGLICRGLGKAAGSTGESLSRRPPTLSSSAGSFLNLGKGVTSVLKVLLWKVFWQLSFRALHSVVIMYTSAGRRLIPALCPLAAGRVSVLGSLRCESSHTSQSASTGSGQVKSDKSTLELERDKFGHPRMPHRGYFEEDKCDERREWMENVTGTRLDYIGDWWTVDGQRNSEAREKFPTTTLKGNVENAIGMQTIPVGATGPLLVRGHHTNNSVVVPYATLEPGVCASATRGARVLTLSGGVVARVTGVGQRRSPAFYFDSMAESRIFAEWIKDQVPAIRASMKEVSQHGKLQKVQPIIQGRGVTVNCLFVTGDAAGQNMVTSLTNNAYK